MPAQQRTITSREQQEERILRFSFLCSTFFTITEVAMAVVFHSYSILMDGIFDIADLILLGPFLVLVPLLYKPVTEKHPYGYSQLESVFLIVKYGILLFVIISMIGANIGVILEGGHTVDFNGVAVYEMLIGFLCLLVLLALKYLSRKFNSPTIEAEVYLWKQDAVSTCILFTADSEEYAGRGDCSVSGFCGCDYHGLRSDSRACDIDFSRLS